MSTTLSSGHRKATNRSAPLPTDLELIDSMELTFHGMPMFLSQEEIEALTGLKRPSFQCKWLRQNGFVFILGNDRKPKVLQRTLFDRFDRNIKKGTRYIKEPEVRL
jgi:hypothetical protein